MDGIWQWTDALVIAAWTVGGAGIWWLHARAYAATGSIIGVAPGVPPSTMRGRVRQRGPLTLMTLGMLLFGAHAVLTAPERGSAADRTIAEALRADALLFGGFAIAILGAFWMSMRLHRATGHPMGIVSDAEAAKMREGVPMAGPIALLMISTFLITLHAVVIR